MRPILTFGHQLYLFSLTSEAAIQILVGIDGQAQIQGEGKPSAEAMIVEEDVDQAEAMIVEEDVDQAPEASTNWRTRCGM